MSSIKNYKIPIILSGLTIGILMLMLTIGFTLGILSENPDGLERILIDQYGEEWLENMSTPWNPLGSWITNDYVVGVIGFILTLSIIMAIFTLSKYSKKKKNKKEFEDTV